MFGKKYRERLNSIEDRMNRQWEKINSLKLDLEAYRDHGVYIGKRYQHKDGGNTFEMNTFTYKNILCNGTSFDDYVQVAYQQIDNDVDVSVDIDTTDAEEEIDRLNKELVQFKSVPESVLKLLHKTLDEMSGGHTM